MGGLNHLAMVIIALALCVLVKHYNQLWSGSFNSNIGLKEHQKHILQ